MDLLPSLLGLVGNDLPFGHCFILPGLLLYQFVPFYI